MPGVLSAWKGREPGYTPKQHVPTLNTIVQLSDAAGTSMTIKPPAQYEEVIKEFQAAWQEKRLMRVWSEHQGQVIRVNPQQVAYIRQLEY